jgi:hypothetical protein
MPSKLGSTYILPASFFRRQGNKKGEAKPPRLPVCHHQIEKLAAAVSLGDKFSILH